MRIYHLIFSIKLFFFCSTENLQAKAFLKPDLRVDFQQDGETIPLEAFKSHENDLIMKEKNVQSYEKLKWYSIGNPLFVKVKSNDSEYIFQFNRRGFYARIEMLTVKHKQLLIDEVKRVYNITIGLNQIDHLILSSLSCEIPILKGHNANEEDTIIKVNEFGYYSMFLKFNTH
jgi:hypothetical protein